jgi:hypothetical protein
LPCPHHQPLQSDQKAKTPNGSINMYQLIYRPRKVRYCRTLRSTLDADLCIDTSQLSLQKAMVKVVS